jgi:hypothetical protein
MASFISWFIDRIASEVVIDLYFVLSGIFKIDLTEAEIAETAHMDATAQHAASRPASEHECGIPVGKRVY